MKLRIILFLFLAAIAIGILAPRVSAQIPVACEQSYIVVAGDWLVNLANKFYGDPGMYNAIFLATNLQAQTDSSYATLSTPTLVEVGAKLCIPSKTDAAQLLISDITITPTTATAVPSVTPAATPVVAIPTITPVQSTANGLSVSAITFNPYDLAANIQGQVVPASAYNNSEPPGPVGAPAHVAFQFDGVDRLWVIPAQAYQAQWDAAGNNTISRSLTQLRLLLRDKPTNPQLPLPFLPPVPATNDLTARVRYLDFDGGSGIAYLARWAQDPSPVLSTQIEYAFLGLTRDGKYIVSFRYLVQTSALPDTVDELTPQHLAEITANPAAYFVQTIDLLNKLGNSSFGPDLSRLDALVFSLNVPTTDAIQPTPAGTFPTAVMPGNGSSATPAAPSSDGANKQRLLATDWKWLSTTTSAQTITVDDPDKYGLRFNNANGFGVTADCNIGAGNYSVSGSTLTIKDLQSTLIFCGASSLDKTFTTELLTAASFPFDGANLVITLKDGSTMRFRK